MQLRDIKPGHWYETKQGEGIAERVGGTRPPSVIVRIVRPFPRGLINVTPRDVLREIEPPVIQ